MRLARARINLSDIGIREMKPRRARTGALLLEIPGAEGPQLADALADRLRTVLAEKQGVTVTRPQKTAEIRVRDLEDSISADEIAAVLAERGGCHPEEIRVGPIQMTPNGMGSAWMKCPVTAANTVVRGGPLTIGWTRVKVEMLPERPLRCYKCWGKGHVRATCTSEEDRTGACYRCGQNGHAARDCRAPVQYAICAGSNRPANHRAGGTACKAPVPRRGKKGGVGKPPASPPPIAAPPGSGTLMEVEAEAVQRALPKRHAPSGSIGEGKLREERTTTRKGGRQSLCRPPDPTPMEGVEPEAGPSSREDPAPIAPVPTPGEEKEEGRPAGADEVAIRPTNGE